MTEPTKTEVVRIAERSALAAVVVDEGSTVAFAANDNSICATLSTSVEFGPSCAEYCGKAFDRAAEGAAAYRCHAGLDCVAVRLSAEKPLVAIVGRAFTSAENYRRATERAISGDWSKFPPTAIFENILLTGSTRNIDDAAAKIAALAPLPAPVGTAAPVVADRAEPESLPIPGPENEVAVEPDQKSEIGEMLREFNEKPAEIVAVGGPPSSEAEELAAWRSFFGALASLKYHDACESILDFVRDRYGLASLGWLELRDRGFEIVASTGSLEGRRFRINLNPEDRRLFRAIETESPLLLRERTTAGDATERRTVSIFPIAVGDAVQNALVIAEATLDPETTRHLARFCQSVASEIEVLRLREEVRRRSSLARAVERFNASLRNLDTEDFWPNLMQMSAELMNAERSSLLLLDEKTDRLTVRAAVGSSAMEIAESGEPVGNRVARGVLGEGRPVVVGDVSKVGVGPAPKDWKYKTGSFICYPFVIGDRRIGILNVADKADGTAYSALDLEVLDAIAPQVAVVIDRAALKEKAGAFEQLSVTDPLTGLLNRRYLEERLAEEVKRSHRYGYPMSFLMIDVDDFGKFNKDFGVLVGDRVLREAADAMRSTLRGADVAARYGGEEFCVLLPQTTTAEARTIAERIRQSVENVELAERPITISVGISSYSFALDAPVEIIRAADEAMRRAKSAGKNNVQVFETDDGAAGETVDLR
jgi:diguanylate cyclase (GGDEF)-like protein